MNSAIIVNPWTPADADKHKKGLSSSQKKKWAATANSVRASCIADGGSAKTCDGKAIRIANFQVAKKPKTQERAMKHTNSLVTNESKWDSVDQKKLPKEAFARVGSQGKRNSWSYAHHWVVDGKLHVHRQALKEQWEKIQQGAKTLPEIREHLAAHRKALGIDGQRIKAQMSVDTRWDILDGKTVLVVPAVMLMEGVFNNVAYVPEELEKYPEAWNGRPVTVGHPTENGEFVSAGDPSILEDIGIGKLFNTKWDDGKLVSEMWIGLDRANEVDSSIMEMLTENQMLEISTGLYVDEERIENGELDGKSYAFMARNYRPDHLAVLPGGTGACSIEDGCGAPRMNEGVGGEDNEEAGLVHKLLTWMRGEKASIQAQELNHGEIDNHLRAAIKTQLNLEKNDWVYVKEVFDKYCIYEHEDGDGITRLYKQAYVIDDEDHVLLTDEAKEVKEVTSFVLVAQQAEPSNKPEGAIQMEEEDRTAKVEALIACEECPFTEEDRGGLLALSDQALDALDLEEGAEGEGDDGAGKTPKPAEGEGVVKPPDPVANADAPEGDGKPKPLTKEDVLLIVREEQDNASKTPLIDRLLAHEKCTVPKEDLEVMSETGLVELAKSLIPGDFSGRGAPQSNEGEDNEVPDMPDVDFKAASNKTQTPK